MNNESAPDTGVAYGCHPAPLWMRIVALVVSGVVIGLGGVGNLTTLIAFAKSPVLWRFDNINVFCMTLNDLVLTVYVCGHFIEKYWLGCWRFSITYCHVYSTVNGFTFHAGLILLALIAYDRYLMVKYGAEYRTKENATRILSRTIPLAIILPAGICFFGSWFHVFTGAQLNVDGICLPEIVQSVLFYQLLTWMGLMGPLGSMLFCYISVYRRRLKPTALIAVTAANTVVVSSAQLRKQQRATRMLNKLFAVVVITSAPFVILTVIASLITSGAAPGLDGAFWLALFEVSFPIAWLNNAINPLLYAHTMPEYSRTMRDVWRPVLNWSVPKWFVADQQQQQAPTTSNRTHSRAGTAAAAAANAGNKVGMMSIKSVGVVPSSMAIRTINITSTL